MFTQNTSPPLPVENDGTVEYGEVNQFLCDNLRLIKLSAGDILYIPNPFCSQLIDLKTRRKCTEWPCVKPLHYQQEDGYLQLWSYNFLGNFFGILQEDLANIKI